MAVEHLGNSAFGSSHRPDETSLLLRLYTSLTGKSIELGMGHCESAFCTEVARHSSNRLREISSFLIEEDIIQKHAAISCTAAVPAEFHFFGRGHIKTYSRWTDQLGRHGEVCVVLIFLTARQNS